MDHQLTIFATGEALGGLVRRIATVAAGATVLYGRGIWRDDDGELLDEPSATIVTIGDSDQAPPSCGSCRDGSTTRTRCEARARRC